MRWQVSRLEHLTRGPLSFQEPITSDMRGNTYTRTDAHPSFTWRAQLREYHCCDSRYNRSGLEHRATERKRAFVHVVRDWPEFLEGAFSLVSPHWSLVWSSSLYAWRFVSTEYGTEYAQRSKYISIRNDLTILDGLITCGDRINL